MLNKIGVGMKKISILILILSTFLYAQEQNNIFNVDNIEFEISIWGTNNEGTYENNSLFFEAGFFMSGIFGDSIWSNGAMVEVGDYRPGKFGSEFDDPLNQVYFIRSSDPPFGGVWQKWSDAVSLGAEFYDGDNDGIYDPVDLNGNGKWDLDEDRPDLIGEITAWTVFNDDSTSGYNKKFDAPVLGIEIHQTIFAGLNPQLQNVFFVRYKIINTGLEAEVLDSVYFGIAADHDIGQRYHRDLSGSDINRNAGFAYKKEYDEQYGFTAPCTMIDLLQGPVTYISNETFIDNNGNEVFDKGIDTPLDTAYNYQGMLKGIAEFPGAKNLQATSFTQYVRGVDLLDDPRTKEALRNYLIGGLYSTGEEIDVCDYYFGNGEDLDTCDQVDPTFMFSGDPVDSTGWLAVKPRDMRNMINTGPFQLRKNEPVTIIGAYIVGRGTDYLNSITVAREMDDIVQKIYDNNFEDMITSVEYNEELPVEFALEDIYPNPFNPSTNIQFSLPESGVVNVSVYNVIGEKVTEIVNDKFSAGTHKINWNASNNPSGVYFIRLDAGKYNSVKKAILLK